MSVSALLSPAIEMRIQPRGMKRRAGLSLGSGNDHTRGRFVEMAQPLPIPTVPERQRVSGKLAVRAKQERPGNEAAVQINIGSRGALGR